MKLLKHLVLFFLLVITVRPVFAQFETHLYVADVPASSTLSASELTKQGWHAVLRKLTGQPLADLPVDVATPSDRALEALVDRFEYRSDGGERVFHVIFSVSSVNALLRQRGVTLWAPDRPSTLYWVMFVDDSGVVSLLSMDDPRAQSLFDLADQYAYPLVLPLGDLHDDEPLSRMAAAISPASLAALANRYHVSRVLVGRLKTGVASEWLWWSAADASSHQWQHPDDPDTATVLASALKKGVYIESSFDRQPSAKAEPRKQTVLILGLHSLLDSERLADSLNKEHAILHWEHDGLLVDGIRLSIESRQSRDMLRRVLSHVPELSPLTFGLNTGLGKENEALIYVWGDVTAEQRAFWYHRYVDASLKAKQNSEPLVSPAKKTDSSKKMNAEEQAQSFAYHADESFRIPGDKQAKEVSEKPLLVQESLTPNEASINDREPSVEDDHIEEE